MALGGKHSCNTNSYRKWAASQSFLGKVAKHKERGGEPYKEIPQNAEEEKQLLLV